ncbi:1-aminocyclopropane-1-carboxylate oxidase-like protein 1 [Forsythia ovata]|uniref:1-aminocyclopropane-1-carboxylate oxidase-like protein 1 n=1 Tax=Forsythia ovata TaxID=205694 RepID=A0ABD1R624_9LAMI
MGSENKSEIKPYDRLSELKAFDETKSGVRGLVDSGITKVPRIFIQPQDSPDRVTTTPRNIGLSIPIIDLDGVDKDPIKYKDIVDKIRDASETWGFFQVVNHGIPESDMEEIKNGVSRFFDQDNEIRKQYYTRDATKPVVYNTNFDLFTGIAANWRDTVYCMMSPNPPKPEELPAACGYVCSICCKDIKLRVSLTLHLCPLVHLWVCVPASKLERDSGEPSRISA